VITKSARQCDIPAGLAFIAGTLSKIESGILDLLPPPITSDSNLKYVKAGGFIVGEITPDLILSGFPADDRRSLSNYFRDCVLEVAVAGNQTIAQEIIDGKISFVDLINRSSSGAHFTTVYDSGTEKVLTCTEAGNFILQKFNNPSYINKVLQNACKAAGYDDASAPLCISVLTSWVSKVCLLKLCFLKNLLFETLLFLKFHIRFFPAFLLFLCFCRPSIHLLLRKSLNLLLL